MKSSIAIITARGGSKRIPRKNIRSFCGKPIISYSIQAALRAGIFDEVMVSTDDHEIAELAVKEGAKVPFMRSEKNSNDHATTADVIGEVLDRYEAEGRSFNSFCCIYPTAPFITDSKLRRAFDLLLETKANVVIPVVRFSYPIQRALRIKDNYLSMIKPDFMNSRSQDLEPSYHDCGQFYFGQTKPFLKGGRQLFTELTAPMVLPDMEVQDIDDEQDWKIAELKFQLMSKS